MVKQLLAKKVTDSLKNGDFDSPDPNNVFPYIERNIYEETYKGRRYIVRKRLKTKQLVFYVQQFANNSNSDYIEIELEDVPREVRDNILEELI